MRDIRSTIIVDISMLTSENRSNAMQNSHATEVIIKYSRAADNYSLN